MQGLQQHLLNEAKAKRELADHTRRVALLMARTNDQVRLAQRAQELEQEAGALERQAAAEGRSRL